ncbi:hypothetical protein [Nostoc sp. DSM 114159]|jgi:hypothetical protein
MYKLVITSKFKTAFRKFTRRNADLLMTMFISSIQVRSLILSRQFLKSSIGVARRRHLSCIKVDLVQ